MATQTLKRTRAKFVSKQTVEQVGVFLQTLPEKTPSTHSLRQTVEQLRETIEAALAKGYSYEDLVPMLAQQGIDIQPSTLKRYVLTSSERSTTKRSSSGNTKPRQTRKQPELSAISPTPVPASGKRGRSSAKVTPEPTVIEATETQSKSSKQTRSRRDPVASPATATRGRKTTKA